MTDALPQAGEVAALMRSTDWSKTSIGAPDSWPPSLRTVLRLMLTSRYAMWLGWGPDLLFFYNDAYREQTLGKKHPWALARPAREVWAEIWDAIGPRIEHVLASGEATWDEGLQLFLERSGYAEETYHTFSYSPAFDDAGVVRGLFCVVIEETERVIGERRVALQRDFASALSRTKATGEVLDALRASLEKESRPLPFTLTYLFDDAGEHARLVSSTAFDDGHPAVQEDVRLGAAAAPWPIEQVRATGRPVEVALPADVKWPAGPWKRAPERALVVPIGRAGDARPAGVFVAAINPHRQLDERYRSFVELFVGQLAAGLDNARAYETEKRRAEALAQIDRAKTAFFSNVSHEFRTPLTLMLGPTEDALASDERALRGEALEVVHRNELRLLKLVNALLDFSRIEAGRVEASYEPTDLAGLTADLASAFRSAIERGGLRYEVDCEPIGEPVHVDRDMWEKIVLNLLSNALKFTLEGAVRIALRRRGRSAELVVEDTGPGIAASELPRMFERFHRIEGTPARTHEGSGIGLALVRDLVELHGGTIGVTSELGRGSAFTVAIPLGTAHLPADKLLARRTRARTRVRAASYVAEALRWVPGGSEGEAEPGPHSGRARILVADDNADMREYVARLLRERWAVETVPDGEAALAAIAHSTPDLLVSDVMMPKLDGFALVERLRANAATRTLPIILVSARAGEEATGEGLRVGANDYLIKPFSARELVGRVASQLAIARVRREADASREAQRRVVESLFANAPAGIALIRGERFVIEFANPMALEIWGKDDAVVGTPLLEALPELRGQGFDDLMRDVMRSGKPYVGDELPVTFRRDDRDETLFLKFVYAPAVNDQGVVDGIAAFGFDVTPQVVGRQRAVLGATVGRAFVTNETLPEQLRRCCEALVAFGAASARIWTYNPAHEALELRARSGRERADGSDVRVFAGGAGIGAIVARGAPYTTNRALGDPNVREQGWIADEPITAYAAYPLRVGDRLVGAMDLHARHELSNDVLATLASVADQIALGIERDAGERFRELFIGMLGHDLRNPLNAINMAAHVLTDGELTGGQRRTVDRIRKSADRMTRMITQVLDFTRARAGGGIPIERRPADVHAICAQVVEELAAVHPHRVVDTTYRGDGRGAWDADRLAQLFSNLVGNALTYGRPDAAVRVVVEADASSVTCSVRNEGRPIPNTMLPTLFDPFRRAAYGKTSGTSGLGLGLFIAQQIVLAHGGVIDVRSNEQEGTELAFTLPRAIVEATS